MAQRPIVVIGSINMDLVCRTPAMPRPGETILGGDFVTVPGGKGANQAVAAAKLARGGTGVHMIGRVGADDFGERMLSDLAGHGVVTDRITITEGVSSGIAMILVDKMGENSIVVAPGANARLTPADVDAAEDLIRSAICVVMQLEIPLATVRHALAMCQAHGVYTILDPAPVPEKGLPRALFGVDVLSPNQTEAEMLVGAPSRPRIRTKRVVDPKLLASDLLARGAKNVVLKLGKAGALATDGEGFAAVKGFKVKVVDTTAAGDAFTGALAVAHSEGIETEAAVRFANAAGAICCSGFGAQPSLPTREQVDLLVESKAR
ncbi:MAG TPA: ribokinase [Tepidisphaeraceae bacterium]|jgi:ribokinase